MSNWSRQFYLSIVSKQTNRVGYFSLVWYNIVTVLQLPQQQLLPTLTMPPKTSGKAAAKSGKATKAITKGDKKKRKGKRKESYAIYIYKVGLAKLSWKVLVRSLPASSFGMLENKLA